MGDFGLGVSITIIAYFLIQYLKDKDEHNRKY